METKTTADLKLYKCHKKKIVNSKFDTKILQDLNTREKFQNLQKMWRKHARKWWRNTSTKTLGQHWDACIRAAKEIAPPKKHQHKSDNPEIKKLSEEQKKIRNKVDSIKDPTMIRKARNDRNKIMRKIHKEIEKEETENLDQEIERLEKKYTTTPTECMKQPTFLED